MKKALVDLRIGTTVDYSDRVLHNNWWLLLLLLRLIHVFEIVDSVDRVLLLQRRHHDRMMMVKLLMLLVVMSGKASARRLVHTRCPCRRSCGRVQPLLLCRGCFKVRVAVVVCVVEVVHVHRDSWARITRRVCDVYVVDERTWGGARGNVYFDQGRRGRGDTNAAAVAIVG